MNSYKSKSIDIDHNRPRIVNSKFKDFKWYISKENLLLTISSDILRNVSSNVGGNNRAGNKIRS